MFLQFFDFLSLLHNNIYLYFAAMGKRSRKQGGNRQQGGNRHKGSGQVHPGRQVMGNNPNFALLVKAFYGLLQCFHHDYRLSSTVGDSPAFLKKIKDLDSFVRPAGTNLKVQQKIKAVNRTWADQINITLLEHYIDLKFELKDQITRLLSNDLDVHKAKHIAISWAQRNYRKKLNNVSLDLFNSDVNQLLDPGKPRTTATPTRTPPTTPVPALRGDPPLLRPPGKDQPPPPPRADSPVAGPSWAQVVASPQGPAAATTSMEPAYQRPLPQRMPRPRRRSAGQDYVTPARGHIDTHPRQLALSSPTRTPGPPKDSWTQVTRRRVPVWTAHSTRSKDKEWTLPTIGDAVRTIVIGDSNVNRITAPCDSTTSLLAYPGAKIQHLDKLFQRTKVHTVHRQVDKVIMSIGINDRANNVRATTFPSFRRACNGARALFPNAQVFFVLPNWDTALKSDVQGNLAEFKKMVAQDKTGIVHLIPAIPLSQFLVNYGNDGRSDGIHWTPETANRLLTHWLRFVNTPTKN